MKQAECAAVGIGQDGGGSVFLNDLLPAGDNLVECLVPTDLLPLVAALRADPAQGVGEAVGMIDAVKVGTDFRAKPAPGEMVIGVGLEANCPPIAYFGDDCAGIRTIMRTGSTNKQGTSRGHVALPAVVSGASVDVFSRADQHHIA